MKQNSGEEKNPEIELTAVSIHSSSTGENDIIAFKNPMRNSSKALYAYEAAATGEASLVKGEDVVIIKKADADGWTHVRSQSGTGLVPSSYLQSDTRVVSKNANWKKLRQHVKVANAFKSKGKKNVNRSKSNGKKNVRRLSKVMKSRRNSATNKIN